MIKDLKLNIKIEGLKKDESIDIDLFTDQSDVPFSDEFAISFNNGLIEIYNSNNEIVSKVKVNEEASIDLERTYAIKFNKVNLKNNRKLKITYKNPINLHKQLKNQLKVTTSTSRNSFFRQQGLIEINYITDDIDTGKDIINYANDIFLNQRVSVETEKSRAAINFIDENIQGLEKVVELNKQKLKEFREKNISINVDLETEAIIEKIQIIDKTLSEIEIELSNAAEVYTINNPIYLNILNKKNLLTMQKDEILLQIREMPQEQQEYIDLYNEVEITQKLFEELETRRLGFSILEASTIGDIRVVDDAYMVTKVSPRIVSIFVMTIFGFLISCVIAIVRGVSYLPITNPAELYDNNLFEPIVGVIPYADEINSKFNEKEPISKNEETALSSAFESIIVNLRSLKNEGNKKNIISITSPSPSNGKSTISTYLSESLLKVGNKVLLIDADFKRGKLNKYFDTK